MKPKIPIISHLFSSLLFVCIVAALGSMDYPNQKYVLFKKLPDGRIKKVETLNEPISWEQAIARHGYGRYMLQSMKPRAKVIWNHLSASSKEEGENNGIHLIELQPLERKTNYLAAGLVGLGVGTAIGFGVIGVGHLNTNQVLNRAAIAIDSLLSKYPSLGFLCGTCSTLLMSVFDKFCNQCGHPITSPDRRQLAPPSEERCPKCSFPIRPGQFYCRECGNSLQNQSSRKGWSLP
jgi:hypothetical protein